MKEKRSSPDNIVQGINRVTTGISSMHVDHEAENINRETEYNYDPNNEDDGDSKPTSGA